MIDQATHVDHFDTPKQIIVGNNNATLSIHCSNTGVVADANNKKILKAGTPLYGDYQNRGTAFVKATTSGTPAKSNAVGILLHDVDVTNAEANATIVVQGMINMDKIDTTTAALISTEVTAALPAICFMRG